MLKRLTIEYEAPTVISIDNNVVVTQLTGDIRNISSIGINNREVRADNLPFYILAGERIEFRATAGASPTTLDLYYFEFDNN